MKQLNIEIKAISNNQDWIKEVLKTHHAEFKGVDHQIDTYFKVNTGRLKLREGNIENSLVHYNREDKEEPKQSNVTFYKSADKTSLKGMWTLPTNTSARKRKAKIKLNVRPSFQNFSRFIRGFNN